MRVSLVTGAAGGIGSALVASLSEAGDRVVATDLVTDGIGTGSHEVLALDVRNPDDWDRTVTRIVQRHGSLDRVFNVAGLIRTGSIHESDPTELALQVEVNLLGVIFGTQAAARVMVPQGSGHIINIGSLAGLTPVPGLSGYVASKFGVRGFSLSAALELRRHGVHVSVVCPDATDTALLRQQIHDDAAAVSFSRRTVLSPDDVVAAVHRALESRRPEITLPRSRSGLARLAGLSPRIALLMTPAVTRIGRRNQDGIRRRLERDGAGIQAPRHR